MNKKKVHTQCSSICGCCGGDTTARHSKPTDPEWFGKSHWPTGLPHEKGFGSRCHEDARRHVSPTVLEVNGDTKAVGASTPKLTSTTGLLTLNDFINESKLLGVFEPALVNKIKAWFAKFDHGECGQGMAKMQSNNLLKAAVKRKESNVQK